jgi:hypothetical protein
LKLVRKVQVVDQRRQCGSIALIWAVKVAEYFALSADEARQ